MTKRDNFTKPIKLKLAQRFGYRCSFPKCHKLTVGPILSSAEGVLTVGRACHIEAASKGGPRYNPDMSSEARKSIENGIWCCTVHADLIDNDTELFSVPSLKEWKQLAEKMIYEEIDSSHADIENPFTLVQIGLRIIFKATWSKIDTEKREWEFEINEFVYGDIALVKEYIEYYSTNKENQFVVVEALGYGRTLEIAPSITKLKDKHFISFKFKPREEFSHPDQFVDARLTFEDEGVDLDIFTDDGWVKGKEAVLQSILMELGTNQGQWWADKNFGSFLFKYYPEHHKNHKLLQKLIKLEISRKTSIPESGGLLNQSHEIPISAIKWVDSAVIVGHSENYIELDLKLYFSDNEYYNEIVRVPAKLNEGNCE